MSAMKKIFLISAFLPVFAWAQQLPHYSQYMLNDYVLNPAIGGKNDYWLGMSANRYQWGGIVDAPRTYIMSLHGPLRFNHMGVGAQLFTDIVGPTRRTGFYLSYAYHAPLAENLKLSFGVNAGILQFMVDGQKINLHDPGDLLLTNSLQSVLMPDFSAGFLLHNERFWIGASCLQIAQNKIKFFDYMSNTTSVLNRHFYGMLGYRQPIGEDFMIEPSALLKFVHPAPFQFDIGLRVIYKEKIWIGGSYRHLDAFSGYIGFVLRENIQLGYAYDFTTTNLGNYSTGTHELVIGIRFNKLGVLKNLDSESKFN
jgi:type IX secretion system PorP/SprF family membrane protein